MLSRNDYDLLVLYREPRPRPKNAEDEKRFRGLLARKLVEPVGYKPEAGGLTATHYQAHSAGEDLLKEFEKQAAKEEERQAEKKSDRRFQIRLVLLTVVLTLAGTLLVEHFGTILERIRGLFG